MGFNQTYSGPVQNVYNVEGDLVLSNNSSPQDFRLQLEAIREQVAKEPAIDEAKRAAVVTELAMAEEKAVAPKGRAHEIADHLNRAANTLESVASLTSSASALAKVVFALGTWAAAAFS